MIASRADDYFLQCTNLLSFQFHFQSKLKQTTKFSEKSWENEKFMYNTQVLRIIKYNQLQQFTNIIETTAPHRTKKKHAFILLHILTSV
jgi:hypothetical protein